MNSIYSLRNNSYHVNHENYSLFSVRYLVASFSFSIYSVREFLIIKDRELQMPDVELLLKGERFPVRIDLGHVVVKPGSNAELSRKCGGLNSGIDIYYRYQSAYYHIPDITIDQYNCLLHEAEKSTQAREFIDLRATHTAYVKQGSPYISGVGPDESRIYILFQADANSACARMSLPLHLRIDAAIVEPASMPVHNGMQDTQKNGVNIFMFSHSDFFIFQL